MTNSSSSSALISRMVDMSALFEKWYEHSFAQAVSLTDRQMNLSDLDADSTKIVTYRYKVRSHSCLSNDQMSATTVMAVFDEFSTLHICGYSANSMMPGVSVHMELNVCNNATPPKVGDEVVLQCEVVRMGRTMAFVRGEARNHKTNTVLYTVRHVKYLPAQGALLKFFLTSWRISLFKLMAAWFLSEPKLGADGKPLKDVIIPSLEHTGIGKATFHIEPWHCNPGGILHGGCQSVVMELVGKALAKEELKSENVQLKSIDVTFMSTGVKQIDFAATVVSKEDNLLRMDVQVLRHGTDKIIAEGNLLWSKK